MAARWCLVLSQRTVGMGCEAVAVQHLGLCFEPLDHSDPGLEAMPILVVYL
jgi:hypothetical protein